MRGDFWRTGPEKRRNAPLRVRKEAKTCWHKQRDRMAQAGRQSQPGRSEQRVAQCDGGIKVMYNDRVLAVGLESR